MVGDGDIVGPERKVRLRRREKSPDIKLPLPQADQAGEDTAGVHSDPHVHIHSGIFSNFSDHAEKEEGDMESQGEQT